MGVPSSIIIVNYRTDERDMNAFKRLGIALPLGYNEDVPDCDIRQTIERLLRERSIWKDMSQKGKILINGCGAKKLADIVDNFLSAK